jgi:hypothetical protein
MKNKPLHIAGFLKLVIDALDAAGVDYLLGGAIAEWAWGEPQTNTIRCRKNSRLVKYSRQ